MSGPGLITSYLDALARQLPGQVVEELADGLQETYRRHLGLGLASEAAAQAAVAEFGDPGLIAAEFTRAHPARLTARRLLAAGLAVGACWAVALVTGRAWTWPIPVAAEDRARRDTCRSRGAAGSRIADYPVPGCQPGGRGRVHRHRRAGWFHDHRRAGR